MTSGDEHRILPFRPRGRRTNFASGGGAKGHEPDDLSRYESREEEPDDFRHRMIMNAFAFAAAILLTAAGVWLAIAITDLRKNQDCVLMSRRDCGVVAGRGG